MTQRESDLKLIAEAGPWRTFGGQGGVQCDAADWIECEKAAARELNRIAREVKRQERGKR